MTIHGPRIVTFSGIDGAGKTTQIASLSAQLTQQGYRVAHVTFWDDVAVLSRFRAGVSLAFLQKQPTGNKTGKQQENQNAAQQPEQHRTLRSDKNVHTWYLTLIRSGFYLLDTVQLHRVVTRWLGKEADYVIFDRYLYDQVIQIRSRGWLARSYIRFLLRLAPRPDHSFVLDAVPDEAFARKPEYPLEFMRGYRRAFLGLSEFVPHLVVIEPGGVENVRQQIMQQVDAATSGVHAASNG